MLLGFHKFPLFSTQIFNWLENHNIKKYFGKRIQAQKFKLTDKFQIFMELPIWLPPIDGQP